RRQLDRGRGGSAARRIEAPPVRRGGFGVLIRHGEMVARQGRGRAPKLVMIWRRTCPTKATAYMDLPSGASRKMFHAVRATRRVSSPVARSYRCIGAPRGP